MVGVVTVTRGCVWEFEGSECGLRGLTTTLYYRIIGEIDWWQVTVVTVTCHQPARQNRIHGHQPARQDHFFASHADSLKDNLETSDQPQNRHQPARQDQIDVFHNI